MRVECENSTPTPRPLFKERMAGHHWEKLGTTASDRWKRLGPLAVGRGAADPRVRPNPRWATLLIVRAHCPSNGQKLLELWASQTLLRKDVQIYFSKDFYARKIFLVFFVKNRKVLEKFLACKGVLKIQTCSGKNQKSREK